MKFDPRLTNNIYLVGGYVRDKYLGLNPDDIDVAIENTSEEEMLNMGYKKVHKTLPVFKRKDNIDYALCRTEKKVSEGYSGFTSEIENVSIVDDLRRRDFTINSMAIKYSTNELMDPFNGLLDLTNKVLRATSEAFNEDPVRALRLARFAARFSDFTIENRTKEMAKSLKSELKSEPGERIWKELIKTLSLSEENSKPSQFFRVLKDLDLLDITFPNLYKMTKTFHTNPIHHAEHSVFEHSMRVLDEICFISKDPIVRFAALCHDICKVNLDDSLNLKEGQFHGHDSEELISKVLNDVQQKFNAPNVYIRKAKQAAILHHKFHDIKKLKEKGLQRLISNKYFPKDKNDFMSLIGIVNSDSFGRVKANSIEARMLTKLEVDKLFEEMYAEIDGFIYEVDDTPTDIRYLAKIFDISQEKVDVLSFMNNYRKKYGKEPSSILIKDYIHNFFLRKFRSILYI